MKRCIDLAKNGLSYVAPNPMVGAVLVEDGKIISEGYHQRYGGPHAEVNCLSAIAENTDLSKATIYVNLEPCSHVGKTPPCSDLILERGVGKVVVGASDPNPLVAGQGINQLMKAGVEVISGILQAECEALNQPFHHFHTKQEPWITLKWAETADGYVGLTKLSTASSRKITGHACQALVHQLRASNMAILVGSRTALADDPQLSTRLYPGKSPRILVIAPNTFIPEKSKIFQAADKPVIFTNPGVKQSPLAQVVTLNSNENVVDQVLAFCLHHQIISLLVEGGSHTQQAFISQGKWHRAYRFINPKLSWEHGVEAPEIKGKSILHQSELDSDQLTVYRW